MNNFYYPSAREVQELSVYLNKLYNYCIRNKTTQLLDFFARVSKRAYDAANALIKKLQQTEK